MHGPQFICVLKIFFLFILMYNLLDIDKHLIKVNVCPLFFLRFLIGKIITCIWKAQGVPQ